MIRFPENLFSFLTYPLQFTLHTLSILFLTLLKESKTWTEHFCRKRYILVVLWDITSKVNNLLWYTFTEENSEPCFRKHIIIYNEQPIVHWTKGLNFVPFICAIRFGILRNQESHMYQCDFTWSKHWVNTHFYQGKVKALSLKTYVASRR